MNYQEQLLHPKWQKRRLEIFNRDGFKCVSCGNEERQLHIHHKRYFPNLEAWEYDDEDLITYCDYCHNSYHLIGTDLKDNLMDIIVQNDILVKPLAQICVLSEKHKPFIESLKEFLNKSMAVYLTQKKNNG